MSSAHEIQSDIHCHREENEDVKRACWLPFLFQALAPPQRFSEGSKLSRQGSRVLAGQLEVSMCVDTMAVGGKMAVIRIITNTKLSTLTFAEPLRPS
jgi:hypothetical protein